MTMWMMQFQFCAARHRAEGKYSTVCNMVRGLFNCTRSVSCVNYEVVVRLNRNSCQQALASAGAFFIE